MKRTISEVIDLIKQKKESAEKQLLSVLRPTDNLPGIVKTKIEFFQKIDGNVLRGNIQAYTDVLALLESSHLVEQEKALEILKKAFDIRVEKIKKGVFVSYKLVAHKRCKYLSPEEYELFNEVFKNEEQI